MNAVAARAIGDFDISRPSRETVVAVGKTLEAIARKPVLFGQLYRRVAGRTDLGRDVLRRNRRGGILGGEDVVLAVTVRACGRRRDAPRKRRPVDALFILLQYLSMAGAACPGDVCTGNPGIGT